MYSPALYLINDEYEERRFVGTFDSDSPWKGPPNPQVDEAWELIAETPPFGVSAETLQKIKAPDIESTVWLPESSGGGAMAQLEVTHQLHCLNMLWQFSWFDYYKDKKAMWSDPPEVYRQHMEHCVDLLRQKVRAIGVCFCAAWIGGTDDPTPYANGHDVVQIMCDADAGILTHSWVKNRTRPYPNFNVMHKCRKFESLLRWNFEHMASEPSSGRGVERPPGAVELDDDP
ncbi:hypothetical protein MMC25_001453 [Agyrium rufum]|nr:hypothetical protein [Agyrium rufum]